MLSVSSLRTRVSTRWTLKKRQWWGTKRTVACFRLLLPSRWCSLSPQSCLCAALFDFLVNNEVAITMKNRGLMSPLISRGDIHHSVISKLLAGYWSSAPVISLPSWAPVCGLHSLLSSASSSSACPSCVSHASCSITSTATTWLAAWYVMQYTSCNLLKLPYHRIFAARMINIVTHLVSVVKCLPVSTWSQHEARQPAHRLTRVWILLTWLVNQRCSWKQRLTSPVVFVRSVVLRRRRSSRPWLCVWGSYPRPLSPPTSWQVALVWGGRPAPLAWWLSGALRSQASLGCSRSSHWYVCVHFRLEVEKINII